MTGRFVTGHFVAGRFVTGRFVTGRFVAGRIVTGHFVTGHFVEQVFENYRHIDVYPILHYFFLLLDPDLLTKCEILKSGLGIFKKKV